jgi:hypothetical protein
MINLIIMWLSKNLMDEVVNVMERNQIEEDD